MSTDPNQKPEWKRRFGNQSVSVFVRQRNGDAGVFRSAVLQCSYKDQNGWHNPSVSMTLAEISNAILLLELARQHMEIIADDTPRVHEDSQATTF